MIAAAAAAEDAGNTRPESRKEQGSPCFLHFMPLPARLYNRHPFAMLSAGDFEKLAG